MRLLKIVLPTPNACGPIGRNLMQDRSKPSAAILFLVTVCSKTHELIASRKHFFKEAKMKWGWVLFILALSSFAIAETHFERAAELFDRAESLSSDQIPDKSQLNGYCVEKRRPSILQKKTFLLSAVDDLLFGRLIELIYATGMGAVNYTYILSGLENGELGIEFEEGRGNLFLRKGGSQEGAQYLIFRHKVGTFLAYCWARSE